MNILGFIKTIFGIGGDYLKNRQKLKELKQEQQHELVKAETQAMVDRIMSNTQSDNEIDLITARDKRFTSKDEVLTYLFLIPVVAATVTPFLILYFENGKWVDLNEHIRESYESLNLLPTWYHYILGAIVIDVLGFRSFARKLIERRFSKKEKDEKL